MLHEEAANPGGEAAWTTKGFDGDALLIIFGGQVAIEDGLEFGDGFGKHAGGNFLGADFEEEFDAAVGFGSEFHLRAWLLCGSHRMCAS